MSRDVITSTANPLVKGLALLASRRGREDADAFLVEGRREVERALAGGVDVDLMIVSDLTTGEPPPHPPPGIRYVELGEQAFKKISRRQRPDGIAIRCRIPELVLESIALPDKPLLVVAEAIEKPGNLGAILRTAVGLGATAVIVADPVTDVFNPNVIRSSQGAVFGIPVAVATSRETVDWLHAHGITAIAGQPSGGVAPWQLDVKDRLAVVVGSEADGLSQMWLDTARPVTIPMAQSSGADSLNAATAAALLLYEAVRGRAGA